MDQFDPKVASVPGRPSLDVVDGDPFPFLSSERPVEDYFYSVLMPVLPAGISREAMGALLESRDHFNWEVLTKEVNGEERSVVLFGERHNPDTEECVQAAKQVLQQFPHRALEGFFSENYPCSDLYSEATQKDYELPGAISIAEAETLEQAQQVSVSLDIITKRLSEFCDRLESDPEAPKTLIIDPSELPASEAVLTEALIPLLKVAGPTQISAKSADKPSYLVVSNYLERDHQPGLVGKLHVVNVALGHAAEKILSHGASALTLVGGMFAFPVTAPTYILSDSVLPKIAFYLSLPGAAFFGAVATIGLATRLLPGGMTAFKAVKKANNVLADGYHEERNDTMASKVVELIESGTDKRPLLVQIGRLHVLPIRERLEEDGFTLQIKSEMTAGDLNFTCR